MEIDRDHLGRIAFHAWEKECRLFPSPTSWETVPPEIKSAWARQAEAIATEVAKEYEKQLAAHRAAIDYLLRRINSLEANSEVYPGSLRHL